MLREDLPRSGNTVLFSLVLERVRYENCILTLRAGRQNRDGRTDQFFDMTDILHRLGGQIVPAAGTARRLLPAFERVVNALASSLRTLPCREIIYHPAIEPIAGAHLDLFHAVQHVEFGQRDAVHAIRHHRLADLNRIEPATATLAPRDGPEFVAARAQELADLVV